MRKQRKAAEEKKQRAKAAKDWRDKASGRANLPSTAKRWVTHSLLLCEACRMYSAGARLWSASLYGAQLWLLACNSQVLQGPA